MTALWIVFGIVLFLIAAAAVAAYICYRIAFYSPARKPGEQTAFELPTGSVYEPFLDQMKQWSAETKALPQERFTITSFDGLKLTGTYYEYAPGAPIELMMHGYRGTAQRDLSGGVQRCFQLGRSALLVDQRGSCTSEGKTITFGIREHRDCLRWVDFMIHHFGSDVKIILTGISMGASTVLMAAGTPLPPNVIGVLADCGYTTAKDIIRIVIKMIGLPVGLCYPFVKLGARLYGGFKLEEYSALEAMKNCKVPVIFYHGEADDFVPMEMSKRNYEACVSRKQLVIIPGAGHGLSFPVNPEMYYSTLKDFFGPEGSYQAPQN